MTFFRTNIITLFSKAVCLGSALFISVYIARFLGPSAKGVYYLFIQVVSIIATVSLLGVDTSAIYYLGKGYSAKSVVYVSTVITAITGMMMAIALVAAYHWPAIRYGILSEADHSYILIIATAIPFMSMVRLNSAIVMGFNKYIVFNVLNIALFCILAVSFMIFTVFMHMGLLGAFISFVFAYIFMSIIYCFVIFRSEVMHSPNGARAGPKMLIGYGLRVFLVPITLIIIYRADSFILGYSTNTSAVGFYSVALSFAELLLFIPESIGTVLFPKLAYIQSQDVRKKFILILRLSIALTAVVAVLFFLAMKYLVLFVYGGVYLESIDIAHILLPGLFAMSTYYLFASYFQAVGRPGVVSIILGIILVEKLALCWLLIPKLNAIGAAMASTLSYCTCFAIFLFVFRMKVKTTLSELLLFRQSDVNLIRSSLNNIFDFQK